MSGLTRGAIIKVKRGRTTRTAYVLDTFTANGQLWVEYSLVTHAEGGSIVVGRPRHYEQASKVTVAA
jgi:hypothetical protein